MYSRITCTLLTCGVQGLWYVVYACVYVCVYMCVYMCVYVSVGTHSHTTRNKAAKKWVQCHTGLIKQDIFVNPQELWHKILC